LVSAVKRQKITNANNLPIFTKMYAKIYQKFTMVNCKNNLPFTDLLTTGVSSKKLPQ
jgi:hypothetical protein